MSKLWFPIIDANKCTGCLACYNKCKRGVYAIQDCKPQVINKEGCVEGCHGCGNLCPEQAIVYSGESDPSIKSNCNCSN